MSPVAIQISVVEKDNQAAMEALFGKDSLFGGAFKNVTRSVDIGIFQGKKEEDGTPCAVVAAAHEFGTKQSGGHIPERSFMRSAVSIGRNKINERLRADLRALLEGRGNSKMVFSRVGRLVASLMQARIRDSKSWATPLKPATIARKGSDVPLIDTSRMIASITYRLEGEQPKPTK